MIEYYILNNIYRLLLMGEANRLGIIDTDKYKDMLIELLSVYQSKNEVNE